MMNRSRHRICRTVAAATFFTAFALARPSFAGSALSGQNAHGGDAPAALVLAQANPADTAPAAPPSEQTHKRGSPVDRVETRIQADAHAEGLKKLGPAFEALYNTMSDEQKKNADAVFDKFERRPRHSKG